ncbi:flagellin lysine-N-methylase [Clostridium paraputrificum]|uniref:flagellin lysine-N-methylase n=1 Tax=Clostridium paraputrificum TaxID=29363 RepID=UPI000DD053F4|nr:flagellin lysine-N-methylase [Clostridium paraputrificum]
MKVNMFIPKYMEDFKCVGSKCVDTCCAGWDINIDENTYNRYENSESKLKELVHGKYKINNYEHDVFNHGFMILKNKKKCPFLNSNMLCDIHGNIGKEHLCITCKSYPRVYNIIDDIYEKSGLTSCYEICLKALLNKEKIEFIEIEDELDIDNIEIRRIIDSEAFQGSDNLLQYFWDIRLITINILQNRKYSIEYRLDILGCFFSRIEESFKNNDFYTIEELIEDFSNEEYSFSFINKGSYDDNREFYHSLCDDNLIQEIKSVRLKECVKEYKKSKEKIELYKLYNSKLESFEYIFENYLVNKVFTDLIPFNKGEDLYLGINYLINIYKVIKAYVIGIAVGNEEEITENGILRVIQALSKDIEHNKVFEEILLS